MILIYGRAVSQADYAIPRVGRWEQIEFILRQSSQ